jgi:hypothetical protein
LVSITRHASPGRSALTYWLIAGSLIAAVIAVLPIVLAIFGAPAAPAVTRTAFATAPTGSYVVVSRSEANFDVISVAPAAAPAEAIEIARVPHLPGYSSSGAVSPDGRYLALVNADAGTVAQPRASLLVLDLETGALLRVATNVDYLLTPVWQPDGNAVVITRTETGESGLASVALVAVRANAGGETELVTFSMVLGAFPVGYDPAGVLVTVVIDTQGSTAYRGDRPIAHLSSQITRDWQLSPDGTGLAFIETSLADGLRYVARTVSLKAAISGVSAQASSLSSGQQLGAAWKPGAGAPTFGQEPGSAVSAAGVSAQGMSTAGAGFDIPVGYSPQGSLLLVEHWSGDSFSEPGSMELQLVNENGERLSLGDFSRVFGWAVR